MTKAAVVPPPTPTDKEVDVEIQEIEDGGNEVTGGRSGGEEQSSFSSLEAASSESRGSTWQRQCIYGREVVEVLYNVLCLNLD